MVTMLLAMALLAPREIDGDRILLADLVEGVPAEIAGLDLGPAPEPGKRRVITARSIRRRLREARIPASRLRIPARVAVVRPKQVLTEGELEDLVRAATLREGPPGVVLRSVRGRGALELPKGEVIVNIQWPRRVREGKQSLRVEVDVEGRREAVALVTAELDVRLGKLAVERGERVDIIARVGPVIVRGAGIAQQKGRYGDLIRVLPDGAMRVVEGVIGESGAVEVRP